jgi:hypothetical protein
MHMFAPPPEPGVQVCIRAQSVFVAQLVLHPAATSHAKGAQSTRVPSAHMPLEHVDGAR